MASLNNESHGSASSGSENSQATFHSAPVSSVPGTYWGLSLHPCKRFVPALGHPGPALGLHDAWPEVGQSLPPNGLSTAGQQL